MKIILLKDQDNLGTAGEMVDVKDGYARNYLLPRKIAIEATKENRENWEEEMKARQEEERVAREEANRIKEVIEDLTIEIGARGGEEGKLFGSITNTEVSNALKEQADLDVAKKKIEMENIKTTGLHEVTIRVYPEITATLKVKVEEA